MQRYLTPSLRLFAVLIALLVVSTPRVSAQEVPEFEWPPHGWLLVDDVWLPPEAVCGDGSYTIVWWPGGVVPISYDSTVTTAQQAQFEVALAEVEAIASVTFVPWSGQQSVVVVQHSPEPDVSYSALGMRGGPQALQVAQFHWGQKYILVHELFHTMGAYHEHQRPDRDPYITVNLANIDPSRHVHFAKSPIIATRVTGAYDLLSIMHYGQDAFSTGAGQSITCNAGYAQYQNLIGNGSYMTNLDATGLASIYGAPRAPTVTRLLPSSVNAGGGTDVTITVRGQYFFDGPVVPEGVQGTEVFWNGNPVPTTFASDTELQAVVPAHLLRWTGTFQISVRNDPDAGGASNSLPFRVSWPPCGTQNDQVGYAVAAMGDIDGDLCDDYLVGGPGFGGHGAVWCYSGRTGEQLWYLPGVAGDFLGFSVARVGDIDRDGIADAVVGAPGHNGAVGQVRFVRGTGGVLFMASGVVSGGQFGYSVAGAGDVNGDGYPDAVVGNPFTTGGAAYVISGRDGSRIFARSSGVSGARFGFSVAGGHDVNSDGIPDFIVGAPEYDGPNGQRCGAAFLYSGANGAALTSKYGDARQDDFGRSVAFIPTMSYYATAFIAVGAVDSGDVFGSYAGPGYVRVFWDDNRFGPYRELVTWTGGAVGDWFGQSVSSAGDVDGDGIADVAIGANQGGLGMGAATGPGYIQIYSGRSWDLLWETGGANTGDYFGHAVAGVGDTNGDAVLDLLIGEPFADEPCPNSGGYDVLRPQVAPVWERVMITEVSTGEPDGLEITNFGENPAPLRDWRIVWASAPLWQPAIGTLPSLSLQPGEIMIVKEPGGTIPELPWGTQVHSVLPSLSSHSAAVVVALVTPAGQVVDEVRIAGTSNEDPRHTLGGRFRGYVQNLQFGQYLLPTQAERAWGLDSNSGADWTSGGLRSFGLENRSSGLRGVDPLPRPRVLINELDDSPDYIELAIFDDVNVQGWTILASALQGAAHVRLRPFPGPSYRGWLSYVVIGDAATPPGELPMLGKYFDLSAVGGGNIPWVAREYDCALYDHYGRLVDLVRTTGPGTVQAHNHPRAPAHWSDFTDAASREVSGSGAVGRNRASDDANVGDDWRPQPVRTMGSINTSAGSWVPDPSIGLDVRLNATAAGGGMTIILNGGPGRAGSQWAFALSLGHANGTGPIFGLGSNAVLTSFFGALDSRGSARLDLPAGFFPPNLAMDTIFLLVNSSGYLTYMSHVLAYDS